MDSKHAQWVDAKIASLVAVEGDPRIVWAVDTLVSARRGLARRGVDVFGMIPQALKISDAEREQLSARISEALHALGRRAVADGSPDLLIDLAEFSRRYDVEELAHVAAVAESATPTSWRQLLDHVERRVDTDRQGNAAPALALLSSLERTLYAASEADAEIRNGGIHQYLYNSVGSIAPEAAEAFEALGMSACGRALRSALAFFGVEYIRALADRRAALPDGSEEDRDSWDPFAELDADYYAAINAEGGSFEEHAARYFEARRARSVEP